MKFAENALAVKKLSAQEALERLEKVAANLELSSVTLKDDRTPIEEFEYILERLDPAASRVSEPFKRFEADVETLAEQLKRRDVAAAEKLTLPDVKTFQRTLLPEFELEAFVCGNMVEAEAEAVVRQLQNALPAKPLPEERRPVRRVRKVPAGAALQQFVAENSAEENSATEIYFQIGADEGDDEDGKEADRHEQTTNDE